MGFLLLKGYLRLLVAPKPTIAIIVANRMEITETIIVAGKPVTIVCLVSQPPLAVQLPDSVQFRTFKTALQSFSPALPALIPPIVSPIISPIPSPILCLDGRQTRQARADYKTYTQC
jgi:hypothetical protein